MAPGHISGLDYTDDGRRLVVAERSGATYAIDGDAGTQGKPVQFDGRVQQVDASPDNHTAIHLTSDRFVHFDIDSRRVLSEGVIGLVPCVGEFSPDGRRFVVGGTFGEVRVLDVEAGEWVGPARRGHDGEVCGVRYAPDGAMSPPGQQMARSSCGTASPALK